MNCVCCLSAFLVFRQRKYYHVTGRHGQRSWRGAQWRRTRSPSLSLRRCCCILPVVIADNFSTHLLLSLSKPRDFVLNLAPVVALSPALRGDFLLCESSNLVLAASHYCRIIGDGDQGSSTNNVLGNCFLLLLFDLYSTLPGCSTSSLFYPKV